MKTIGRGGCPNAAVSRASTLTETPGRVRRHHHHGRRRRHGQRRTRHPRARRRHRLWRPRDAGTLGHLHRDSTGAALVLAPEMWWVGLIAGFLLAIVVEMTLDVALQRPHVPEPALAACLIAGITAIMHLVSRTARLSATVRSAALPSTELAPRSRSVRPRSPPDAPARVPSPHRRRGGTRDSDEGARDSAARCRARKVGDPLRRGSRPCACTTYRRWTDRPITCSVAAHSRDGASGRRAGGWQAIPAGVIGGVRESECWRLAGGDALAERHVS